MLRNRDQAHIERDQLAKFLDEQQQLRTDILSGQPRQTLGTLLKDTLRSFGAGAAPQEQQQQLEKVEQRISTLQAALQHSEKNLEEAESAVGAELERWQQQRGGSLQQALTAYVAAQASFHAAQQALWQRLLQ